LIRVNGEYWGACAPYPRQDIGNNFSESRFHATSRCLVGDLYYGVRLVSPSVGL
jgi:hypothetical protein